MEIAYQELRDRYQNSSTDDLLLIKISSDLTDMANFLLEEELSTRNVTTNDIRYAENAVEALKAGRESAKKVSSRIQRFVFKLVFVALLAICIKFLQ